MYYNIDFGYKPISNHTLFIHFRNKHKVEEEWNDVKTLEGREGVLQLSLSWLLRLDSSVIIFFSPLPLSLL